MKPLLLFGLLFSSFFTYYAQTQAPTLYIHFVSHNEPSDNIDASMFSYMKAKNNALQMANIINNKGVKWNLQTSDGFVIGALQYESAGTSSVDFFETISNAPYNDNIEIDPRSKNSGGRNIADQWYLLDSCGANPSHHLGGCIYSTTNAMAQPIDWLQYRTPIIGNIYGNSWQCSMITGAGSYPPHSNDLNDFGIFKPDTTTNFYHHNTSKNLWCMGTGCAPVLDSLSDEQEIIDLIQGQVDSIQNGLWPADKFYVTRIMTNQREYGPLFFEKIARVIDSLSLIPSNQLQWATISEVFTAFEAWQISSGEDHSQWLCGEVFTAINEPALEDRFFLYPNPSSGLVYLQNAPTDMWVSVYNLLGERILLVSPGTSEIDLSGYKSGPYIFEGVSRDRRSRTLVFME